MLYVFLVDTGTMIQLDMNLALEKVTYLKGVIARSCRIPCEKQVLLISGGESLDPEERVCKYSAGTDTNPIFLFSMLNIENSTPPEVQTEIASEFVESELNEKVNASLKLDDAQSTVAIRATLAQEYVKASSEQTRVCELLIHDQHLQHQGWSAVVANLEDLATDLRKHSERLSTEFSEYLEKRDEHMEVIDNFDEDIAVLHRIPVFPALLNPKINPEMSMVSSTSFSSDSVSLLEWINTKGSPQSLQQVAEGCYRSLQKLDQDLLEELKGKVNTASDGAQNQQMKEIRGLGDRLAGLEQLLIEAQKLVKEQQELAAAFLQNQQRASGLRDVSILPDLCASHRQQLLVMRKNHSQIISICNRTAKAKNELSANLHCRMKWVVFIQNQISEVGQLLVMHVEELKRLRRKLDVIEQIHMAPSIYLATAVEVVRRRSFSDHYLNKAVRIADTFSGLHDEELQLRKNYQAKLKRHFLSKMFPGMEDSVPTFATERPEDFDQYLPEITLEDVESLRKQFPDLAKSLSLPEENALSHLLQKSFNQKLTEEDGETLFSLQNIPRKINLNTNIGSMSVMHQLMSGAVRKPTARKSAPVSDTDESDEDDNNHKVRSRRFSNGKNRKKAADKLTRSLPHESVISLTKNLSLNGDNDKSTSSNDPTTSSNNTTGNNSVAPSSSSGDNSVTKLAEERALLISSLNDKVVQSESKLTKLQSSVKSNLQPCCHSLNNLKTELANIKAKILEDKKEFDLYYSGMSKNILDEVQKVNENSNKKLSTVLLDMESRVRKESESDIDKIRRQLELEMQKLEDCHNEIDIYRQQLEQAAQEVDKLKTDLIEAKEIHDGETTKLKEASEIEKADIIKKLTLEHEIELDALREELENSERVANCESEVKRLREVLQMKESDVEALRRKTRLMEVNQEQRFHEEKEKIVQILEAGFLQREKLSLQKLEEELEAKFQSDLEKTKQDWNQEKCQVLQTVKEEHKVEFEAKLAELESMQNSNIENMVQKAAEDLKNKYDEDKESALKMQYQELTMKSKREMDALRSRFKMMQTTGALLDRSPSCSESEMSLEHQNSSLCNGKSTKSPYKSPRQQDIIENIRGAIKLEYDNNLKGEQAKWAKQMQELKEEHEQNLVEMMSREKIRDIAEQQVLFNEALNKAMEEKDRKIQDLQGQLKKPESDTDLVQQLADLGQKNTQLEAELKEAKLKLEQVMASSVMTLNSPQDPDLQRLQKENAHLKEQLTKSMMVLVSSGKVNVTSVDRGDTVMIVWNEDHNNFSIYTEPTYNLPLHFLHNESIQILGLQNGSKKYVTAEVVDKEYCQAKKSENRFKVPQGTKFYRVRCKATSVKNGNGTNNGGS